MATENGFHSEIKESCYVAFCDILGFSDRLLSSFEETLEIYQTFGARLADLPFTDVETTMYSDAILLTSPRLEAILSATQTLWFVALAHDLMIRGGIARGRYWQYRKGNHLLVASDALVHAVKLEATAKVPAVVLADDIEITDPMWMHRFAAGLLHTPLLHFRDRNIVNPFNSYWFASAQTRTLQLMEKYPAHREKYLWFLALHHAVATDRELIPGDVLSKLLRLGVLKQRSEVEGGA